MIFTCTIITLLLFRCFGFYDECITDAPKERIKNIKYNHPNNLILSHLNINSLRNKFQCLEYIMGDNIDILLLSETKLCDSFPNSRFLMDGFQVPYRADRDFFFFMHFFSGTKHPREDNPNLYYWAEITGLHTNI